MTGLLASAIRLALPLLNIQLSKIDTTSRLPLGARLESTRPRKVPSAPSLIPESHRDRRESIECCHFAVTLMSICCRFDSTFLGVATRGKVFVFSVEAQRRPLKSENHAHSWIWPGPAAISRAAFSLPIHTSMIANK